MTPAKLWDELRQRVRLLVAIDVPAATASSMAGMQRPTVQDVLNSPWTQAERFELATRLQWTAGPWAEHRTGCYRRYYPNGMVAGEVGETASVDGSKFWLADLGSFDNRWPDGISRCRPLDADTGRPGWDDHEIAMHAVDEALAAAADRGPLL